MREDNYRKWVKIIYNHSANLAERTHRLVPWRLASRQVSCAPWPPKHYGCGSIATTIALTWQNEPTALFVGKLHRQLGQCGSMAAGEALTSLVARLSPAPRPWRAIPSQTAGAPPRRRQYPRALP